MWHLFCVLVFFCSSCFSSILVLFVSSGWPTWDICIVLGLLLDVLILLSAVGSWKNLLLPYVWGCWSHYICKPDCGGYPIVDTDEYGWDSCILLLLMFHHPEGGPKCPRRNMEPSCLCSSVVNCMAGSTEFMCCRNSSLLSCFKMTNVSSTNLFHHLGGSLLLLGLCLQKPLYTNWLIQAHRRPHSCPLGLLIILT